MTHRAATLRLAALVVLTASVVSTDGAGAKSPRTDPPDAASATSQRTGASVSRPGLPGRNPERPVAFARSSYVWPYASGPHYGNSGVRRGETEHVLRTVVGSFRLGAGDGTLPLPEELTSPIKLELLGAQYFVVIADERSVKPMLSAIEASGGVIADRLPHRAVVARLTGEALASVQGVAGVVVEPYHGAFKLDPTIGRDASVPIPCEGDDRASTSFKVRLFDGRGSAGSSRRGGRDRRQRPNDHVGHALSPRSTVRSCTCSRRSRPCGGPRREPPITPSTARRRRRRCKTGRYNDGAVPYHRRRRGRRWRGNRGQADLDGAGHGDLARRRATCRTRELDAGTRRCATHRKVRLYESAGQFTGGVGRPARLRRSRSTGGARTATSLRRRFWGRRPDVADSGGPDDYEGPGWVALDLGRITPWALDGVAPGAVLIAYDAQFTPAVGLVPQIPSRNTLTPWRSLRGAPTGGALGASYAYTDAEHAGRRTNRQLLLGHRFGNVLQRGGRGHRRVPVRQGETRWYSCRQATPASSTTTRTDSERPSHVGSPGHDEERSGHRREPKSPTIPARHRRRIALFPQARGLR